jgi:ribosomal protein S18 acetylase RimI-like enzyme
MLLFVCARRSSNKLTKIRPADQADILSILELYNELSITTSQVEQAPSPSSEKYRKVFAEICTDPKHELLVAEDRGQVVGTIALLIVPNLSHSATPYAIAESLIVTQKYRRQGIARQLLEYCIAHARESGCHRIELCSDRRREEAHKLYRSVGFKASAYGFRIYF